MLWKTPRTVNLARLNQGLGVKQPQRSSPLAVPRGIVRARISSVLAVTNPSWLLGANVKWLYQEDGGIEQYVERNALELPINRTCSFLSPDVLDTPLTVFEVPFWVPDAVLTLWEPEPNQQPAGVPMAQLINPFNLEVPPITLPPKANNSVMYQRSSTDTYFELLAANPARLGCMIKNESATKFMFLILSPNGDAISTPLILQPGGVWVDEAGFYTGIIRGFMEQNTPDQRILATEFFYAA